MTSFERGDVILLPFPFSDQSASKVRPGIVAHSKYPSEDLLVVGITSIGDVLRPGEYAIASWREIGLLHPSYVKRAIVTVNSSLIRRRLGKLGTGDSAKLDTAIRLWFGII
jgi:mRNA interferase MazF